MYPNIIWVVTNKLYNGSPFPGLTVERVAGRERVQQQQIKSTEKRRVRNHLHITHISWVRFHPLITETVPSPDIFREPLTAQACWD